MGTAGKYGTEYSDELVGTTVADELFGRDGYDVLRDLAGDDNLYGERDDDRFFGGLGNDSLEGWIGDALIDGGAGNDVPTGEAGYDLLRGSAGQDVFQVAYEDLESRDLVLDFSAGDKLSLAGVAIFIGTATFTDEEQVRVEYRAGNTIVQANVYEDLAPDIELELVGLHQLTAEDFASYDYLL